VLYYFCHPSLMFLSLNLGFLNNLNLNAFSWLTLQLFVHGEKFNQPIFHCNNISGFVEPVSITEYFA
jgi:uncharacterized membrane protein (UPF0182 family)